MLKNPTMTILRGLPGAGKSTFARALLDSTICASFTKVCSADDFFVGPDGIYRFDKDKLPAAHHACQMGAQKAVDTRCNVIIDNTNTQRWEMEPYLRMAHEAGMEVRVVHIDTYLNDDQLAARNTHGVPVEAIGWMRVRFEHDWRNADPRPPWDR